MKLFNKFKNSKKNKKEMSLEDQFIRRDRAIMIIAHDNDQYAEKLPQESYDRLIKYVQKDIVKLDDFKGKSVFVTRMKDTIKNAPVEETKDNDEDSPKQEERKDTSSEEKTQEQKEKEENEKIIDLVEKVNKEEKQQETTTSTEKSEEKVAEKTEQTTESKETKNVEAIDSDSVRKYLLSEGSLDVMAKGISKKYLNLFDKSRDDIMEVFTSISNSKCGQETIAEYAKCISNCVEVMKNTDSNVISKYIKSIKHLKGKSDEIDIVVNIAKSNDDNRTKILLESILALFIAESISFKIGSIARTIRESNKDATDDDILTGIKTELINIKNELEHSPDVAKNKLMFYLYYVNIFIDNVGGKPKNNNQTIGNKYNTDSPFIPKEQKETNKNKEAVFFGDNWKQGGIHFNHEKMIINLNSSKHTDNITKKNAKEIKNILNVLDNIIDKSKWQYSLDPLINGTFELNAIQNSTGNKYTYNIDAGVVLGHGIYLYAGGKYISLEEKEIISKLFSDPERFRLTANEIKQCESYYFNNSNLYDYLDMRGSSSDKIKYLSIEDYKKLGDTLLNILNNVFYKNFNITCRFRFKAFTSIDDFILVSDRFVNNVLNINLGISNIPTTIIYKDNKVVINYGDQTISCNL